MSKHIPYRIGVPLGTRLVGLTRLTDAWQAWIAIRNTSDNPSRWRGTYLLLRDDGFVARITNDTDIDDVFVIKEKDRKDDRTLSIMQTETTITKEC